MEKLAVNISLTLLILFLWNTRTECSDDNGYCKADEDKPFSYNGKTNGREKWGELFPACKGNSESPVNIDRSATTYAMLGKLNFTNYDVPMMNSKMKNFGNAVKINVTDGVNRTIVFNATTYTLREVCFHWGQNSNDGTEHAFNDARYAMEVHLICTDAENRVAVVAILFTASKGSTNPDMERIVNALPKIPYMGDVTVIEQSLNMWNILPTDPTYFYQYYGTATVPPCDGLIWLVMNNTREIVMDQVLEFGKLYSVEKEKATEACRVTENIRPLQPLNNREILRNG